MRNLKGILTVLSGVLFLSCSSDDNVNGPVNEEELITTFRMTLTPQGGGTPIVMTYRDLDGDGSNAPQFTTSGPISASSTYNGNVEVLNETVTPADNITDEIIAEASDHQFFYSLSNGLGSFAYAAPFDSNGKPLGTNFVMTTSNAGSGTFTVILRHEPNKDAQDVSAGDVTNAGGETDLQISFPVIVE